MKTSTLLKLITARVKGLITRPIHIEGSPGIGKTEVAKQAAAQLGIGCMVIHAPLLQPEDYGFPVISADKTDVKFIVSKDKFPVVGSNCPDQGILVIDELPQADASCQKILRNLILEREIHGQRLKDGWFIVTTGNRVSDRAGANKLLTHLSNVLTRVNLDVSVDDWVAWALDNNVAPEVIQFIRFKSDDFNRPNPNSDEAYPTPRAWVQGVSRQLSISDVSYELEAYAGDVGEAAATNFISFLKVYRDLPSIDEIVANPDKAPVPTDISTLYALTGTLVIKTDANNFSHLMRYVSRITGKTADFQVMYVRDVLTRNPKLKTHKEIIKFFSTGEGKKLAGSGD